MAPYARSSREVTDLIGRIRKLVAERRQLQHGQQREATTLEIARLQRRLAVVVRRELATD
jgi:hypothetical protein